MGIKGDIIVHIITKKVKNIISVTAPIGCIIGDTQYLPEYENLTDAVESYYEEAIKPVDKIIASNASYFKSLYDVRTIMYGDSLFQKLISHT